MNADYCRHVEDDVHIGAYCSADVVLIADVPCHEAEPGVSLYLLQVGTQNAVQSEYIVPIL